MQVSLNIRERRIALVLSFPLLPKRAKKRQRMVQTCHGAVLLRWIHLWTLPSVLRVVRISHDFQFYWRSKTIISYNTNFKMFYFVSSPCIIYRHVRHYHHRPSDHLLGPVAQLGNRSWPNRCLKTVDSLLTFDKHVCFR